MSKKKRLHPMQCQPDSPGLKMGTYLQAIEMFGDIRGTSRRRTTTREVNQLKRFAGLKK
jgi:hypothetical protein